MSEDPIGFASGDFNWYRYTLNNPVNYIDPSGEFGLLGAAIGAVIEIGSQLLFNGEKWECIDWWDVAGMAAVGAVAPSSLASGSKIFSSSKAIKALGAQSTRTANRANKIRNRINKHKSRIANEAAIQLGIAAGKYAYKKGNGDNCSDACK